MTEIEITVSTPADAVWQALRDPAEIRRWFGWEYPGLDEEIRLIFVDGTREVDERTLAIGEDRLTLETVGAGTIVRLTRAGSDGVFDPLAEGWLTFLQQLRFALERHPGTDRRTVRLEGVAEDASPADELGLAGAAGSYEVTASTGETLGGEVWFRSERQVGVTVDAYGDGLLVVASEPEAATGVVTTYGLDDEAFEAVRERWRAWWEGQYAKPPGPA